MMNVCLLAMTMGSTPYSAGPTSLVRQSYVGKGRGVGASRVGNRVVRCTFGDRVLAHNLWDPHHYFWGSHRFDFDNCVSLNLRG